MKIIIPVSRFNSYSADGDMAVFGSSTLFEWKLSQAKLIASTTDIFVTTRDESIADKCRGAGINVIKRGGDSSLESLYKETVEEFESPEIIMWLNPTAPFLGPKLLSQIAECYFKDKTIYPMATAFKESEYMYDACNDTIAESLGMYNVSRRVLKPYIRITNGAYISTVADIRKNQSMLGPKIHYVPVPWLASLEIKTELQIQYYSELIYRYFAAES